MTCENCPKRADCKQVCKEMEAYLLEMGIKSAQWIRPKRSGHIRGDGHGTYREVGVKDLDSVATQNAFRIRGRKKVVKTYPETQ